jgi:AcrR family transcriptional regulator
MTTVINTKPRGRPRNFDRQVALERAMEVFWASGYEGTSIPMLTSAMEISAQSLYAAFYSKDALYREAIERYRNTIGGFGARAMDEERDAIEAVTRLLREAAIVFSTHAATPGCMITTAPGGTEENPMTFLGRQLRAESVKKVRARLERGVQEGQVRSDTDCAAWARYIASVVQGLSVQARDAVPADALLSTAEIAGKALATLRA